MKKMQRKVVPFLLSISVFLKVSLVFECFVCFVCFFFFLHHPDFMKKKLSKKKKQKKKMHKGDVIVMTRVNCSYPPFPLLLLTNKLKLYIL